MHRMKALRAFLLPLLACSLAAAEDKGVPREWTSTEGQKISGLMLGTEGDAVALKLANGKVSKVPLARLSEADRKFVAEQGWPLPKPWKKWPGDIRINLNEIQVEEEAGDGQSGKYTYRTGHFEIVSAAKLGQVVVKDVARIFEGTYRLLAASPWGILAEPENGRFRAELYLSRDDYIRAGAPPASAGVYIPSRRVFMVPFESLGLKETPQGWQRSSDYTTKTLIHELTHMLMHDALQTLPIWLVEGTAEYMELMPMRIGAFSPGSHFNALKDHNRQEPAFSLAETFSMDHPTWQKGGKAGGDGYGPVTPFGRAGEVNVPKLYHAGLLLTYYFMHLDGEGDAARLQRFIAASRRNAGRIEEYEKAHADYVAAFQEFIKDPAVQDMGGGNYRFPSTMKPPVAPEFPFDCKPEELPFREIGILLEGRDQAALPAEIRRALEKAGLDPEGAEAP